GCGRWVDRAPTARGGRPTRDFVLHPTADETDETDETSADDEDDGSGTPPKPPDDTPNPPGNTPQIAEKNEVSSVSSPVGPASDDGQKPGAGPESCGEGFVGQPEVSSGIWAGPPAGALSATAEPLPAEVVSEPPVPIAGQLVRERASL